MGGFVAPRPPGGGVSKIADTLRTLAGQVSQAPTGIWRQITDPTFNALVGVADTLLHFAWRIGRALAKLLEALHWIWTRVLWPIIRQLPRAIGRLRRLIERDLPRLLRLINRIRERLIEMYERFWRPVLINIQRIRRMLLILRLFRVKWAEQLDARLGQIQEWIMRPLRIALEHIAVLEQWLNVIVTAEQLIQETIFGRSVYHYQDPLVRSVLTPFTRPMSALEKLELWPRGAAVTPEQSAEQLRQYLRQGAGPIAEDVARSVAEMRRL